MTGSLHSRWCEHSTSGWKFLWAGQWWNPSSITFWEKFVELPELADFDAGVLDWDSTLV